MCCLINNSSWSVPEDKWDSILLMNNWINPWENNVLFLFPQFVYKLLVLDM